MRARANPATTWMASTILGDDACWETLCLIYECGAGSAAVWRTFPLKETMRALMHCLGLSKNGSAIEFVRGWSDADDVTGSQGLEGSLQRGDHPSESVGKGEPGETQSVKERFWEMVRPLHVQTPWNRRNFSAMTFADAEVEANWKEESEEEDVARETKFAAAAAAFGCAYRAGRGDAEVVIDLLSHFRFPTRDGYGARDLGEDVPASAVLLFLRFLPVFFAGGFLLLVRVARNAEARRAAFVLYRLVDAALDVERVYASYDFLSVAVHEAPPPSFAAPLATLWNPRGAIGWARRPSVRVSVFHAGDVSTTRRDDGGGAHRRAQIRFTVRRGRIEWIRSRSGRRGDPGRDVAGVSGGVSARVPRQVQFSHAKFRAEARPRRRPSRPRRRDEEQGQLTKWGGKRRVVSFRGLARPNGTGSHPIPSHPIPRGFHRTRRERVRTVAL